MGHFKLITDHKPLVPLIDCKDLDNVPIRCQRLLLRVMRFNVTAEYAPGKTLIVADTLSRFHAFKSELSETDGFFTRGNRIIIPESL